MELHDIIAGQIKRPPQNVVRLVTAATDELSDQLPEYGQRYREIFGDPIATPTVNGHFYAYFRPVHVGHHRINEVILQAAVYIQPVEEIFKSRVMHSLYRLRALMPYCLPKSNQLVNFSYEPRPHEHERDAMVLGEARLDSRYVDPAQARDFDALLSEIGSHVAGIRQRENQTSW